MTAPPAGVAAQPGLRESPDTGLTQDRAGV